MNKSRRASKSFERIDIWKSSGMSAGSRCRESNSVYPCFLCRRQRPAHSVSGKDLFVKRIKLVPGFAKPGCFGMLIAEVNGVQLHSERGFAVIFRKATTSIRGA